MSKRERRQLSEMQTIIRWIFVLFLVLMIGLFLLEAWLMFFIAKHDGSDSHSGYLTPEIVHTIFGFVGGSMVTIVTFYFANMIKEKLGENDETGETGETRKGEDTPF